ncbi:MAG: sigma-70 family RNA polymerase sigma factor [Clostridia bacterium]|nr:sigma-70 family RNA polymerase sigma factor [Clostridia bacterium]
MGISSSLEISSRVGSRPSALVWDSLHCSTRYARSRMERLAISDAVENLGAREKRILALRYYDGKTQMEVASEVGISQAQVSRLEKNAIAQIKRSISDA